MCALSARIILILCSLQSQRTTIKLDVYCWKIHKEHDTLRILILHRAVVATECVSSAHKYCGWTARETSSMQKLSVGMLAVVTEMEQILCIWFVHVSKFYAIQIYFYLLLTYYSSPLLAQSSLAGVKSRMVEHFGNSLLRLSQKLAAERVCVCVWHSWFVSETIVPYVMKFWQVTFPWVMIYFWLLQ